MLRDAEKLSDGFFLSIDLYSIVDKVIFGELSFFSNCRVVRSSIERFNKEFGDLIYLPNN